MDRRTFLQIMTVGSAAAAVPGIAFGQERPVTNIVTPDFEAQRLAYLKQIRATTIDRILGPVERGLIHVALIDFPIIRESAEKLIEENRGRVGDILEAGMKKLGEDNPFLHLQDLTDEETKSYGELIGRAPEMIRALIEKLLKINPFSEIASRVELKSDYADLLQIFRNELKRWADDVANRLLGIDLNEVQAHIDQYSKPDSGYRHDMVIHHLPFATPLEGFQALFHRIFDLYLQLAHGNKAETVWSNGAEDPRQTLERLFLDPKIKRLALVGHGTWDSISVSGTCADPYEMVAKIVLYYKLYPDNFMTTLQKAAAITKEVIETRGRKGGILPLLGAKNILTGLMAWIVNYRETELYAESDLYRLAKERGLKESDAPRDKEVFRYTCGQNRYRMPNELLRNLKSARSAYGTIDLYNKWGWQLKAEQQRSIDAATKFFPRELLDRIVAVEIGEKVWVEWRLRSTLNARRYSDVGHYERALALAYSRDRYTQEIQFAEWRVERWEREIATCQKSTSSCKVTDEVSFSGHKDGIQTVKRVLLAELRRLEALRAKERRAYFQIPDKNFVSIYDYDIRKLKRQLATCDSGEGKLFCYRFRLDPADPKCEPDDEWCSISIPRVSMDRDRFLRERRAELEKAQAELAVLRKKTSDDFPLVEDKRLYRDPPFVTEKRIQEGDDTTIDGKWLDPTFRDGFFYEVPGFGTAFAKEIRGYEGLAYLGEFLGDPLIQERQGGIGLFKAD